MFINKSVKLISKVLLLSFVVISVTFAIYKESKQTTSADAKNALSENNSKHQYIAYYFHGTARCASCFKIEKYTTETINTKFANELHEGKLVLKIVNVEEGRNRHFINKYSLSTKSVVLSEMKEDKEVKWKNLDQVWNLLSDQIKFETYIENEAKDFLAEKK